jgi:acetyl-CoA C-acetyltransferase
MSMDKINYIDFYSCFPAAVQMACHMLNLDVKDPRGFTVCGGLPYAGGPASAYTLHSMASMVVKLQGKTSQQGLVTGNGWFLTKHAATVLSTDPHSTGKLTNNLMPDLPSRNMPTDASVVNEQATGDATVETYTVEYGRDGEPERGIVLGRTADGERFLSNTTSNTDFLKEFVTTEQVGTTGKVAFVEGKSTFTPD